MEYTFFVTKSKRIYDSMNCLFDEIFQNLKKIYQLIGGRKSKVRSE